MNLRSLFILMLVLVFATAPQVLAQGAEADEPDQGQDGAFFMEIGVWVAQAAGANFSAATVNDPSNPFLTTPIGPTLGTESGIVYNFGYQMPRNLGRITINLYEQSYDDLNSARSTPGVFSFGESLAHPLFAGVNLDGLADAFNADFELSLKDKRLDYGRTAFSSARISGDWFVGWRRVDHRRHTDASYSALVPNFPPFLPPLTDPLPGLDPRDDVVQMRSNFTGRGLETGMNFKAPLVNDFIVLEAGFAIAALRGETDVSYASTTHAYVLDGVLLGPPYDEFGQLSEPDPITGNRVPLATLTTQTDFRIGLVDNSRSSSSLVLETYLAIRWNLWRNLDFVTGFKQTRYDDIATEFRPTVTTTGVGVNLQQFTEVTRSVTYEGFYFSAGYTF